MRITGGAWRSRRLAGPAKGLRVRPTPDALRERAFQILRDDCRGAVVLDLFAGTGVVGLESLSRGADRVVFVDVDRAVVRLIRSNLARFPEIGDAARVMCLPAAAAIRRLARRGESFDLIWADPPFESWQLGAAALALAFASGVVRPGGRVCLECPDRADLGLLPEGLTVERDLAGGASRLLFVAYSA